MRSGRKVASARAWTTRKGCYSTRACSFEVPLSTLSCRSSLHLAVIQRRQSGHSFQLPSNERRAAIGTIWATCHAPS
jgi:hypothetical protein